MGGELGGPGGEAPRFRPQRPRGGPGHSALNQLDFVTGSVIFFVVFHAFHDLYIRHPKPPFSQQVPLACWWLSGVFSHILLILEHKVGCFVVVSMVFSCKSRCVRIVYIYLFSPKLKKVGLYIPFSHLVCMHIWISPFIWDRFSLVISRTIFQVSMHALHNILEKH